MESNTKKENDLKKEYLRSYIPMVKAAKRRGASMQSLGKEAFSSIHAEHSYMTAGPLTSTSPISATHCASSTYRGS